MDTPRLLITMGDVAGIGPEIIAKAWPSLHAHCQPVVIGDPTWLPTEIQCYNPSAVNTKDLPPGQVSAAAGQAAYDWLCYAIDECLAGQADGIVTCPLHKAGLHAAGVQHPGHTEILAERTGAASHAMLLYDDDLPLAVAHVTLHQSLRSVFVGITTTAVFDTLRLLAGILPQLTEQPVRLGVAALNPHAGDGGLFGDEERTVLLPAIERARSEGMNVVGPIPADAIFLPENRTKLNGIACMIHDHGHIAMKLIGGRRAVNITAGLPIVRTSVAHGTAYDIVGQNKADASSLMAAVRTAAKMVHARRRVQDRAGSSGR
jgi:4-hydroxythreonine-4-phosphate dehydrogenase